MPSPIPPRHGMEAQSNASRTSAPRQEQGNKAAAESCARQRLGGEASLPRHRSGDAAFHRTSMYGLPSLYTVAAAYRCTGGGQKCVVIDVYTAGVDIKSPALHPSIHLDTSSEHDRCHARGEDGTRIVAGDAAVGAADVAGMVGELVQRGRIGWNATSGTG